MAQSSGTGDIFKWVLILGGGYLAYEYFIAPMLAAPAPAPTTPTPAGQPPGAATVTVPTTPPASGSSNGQSPMSGPTGNGCPPGWMSPTTIPNSPCVPDPAASSNLSALAAKVLAAAGSKSLTADQWNYYWKQVSGVPQTADLFPAGNRATLLTFTQYLAARQGKNLGISGLGRNYVRRGSLMQFAR